MVKFTVQKLLKNKTKFISIFGALCILLVIPLIVLQSQQQQSANSKAFSISQQATISEVKLFAVPTKFTLNNIVQTTKKTFVFATTSLKEKNTGIQKKDIQGTVIDGPIQVFGSWWWKVDFDAGFDGWISEDYLRKISGNNPPSLPTPTSQPYHVGAPMIVDLKPPDGSTVQKNAVTVTGRVLDDVSPASLLKLTVNGEALGLAPDGSFQKTLAVTKNKNTYPIRASGADRNPRQQTNVITAYLDGSVMYGSDPNRAAALRTYSGGKLKTSAGNLPPYNTDGLPNANDAHIFPNNQLFLSGDVRANENVELTSIHALFLREHNKLAEEIARRNPLLSDEEIYQRTRRIVVAELQVITYKEFIPALLGANALKQYTGYNPDVNPGIANEFSTAAFRIGHTLINDDVEFFDNEGEAVRDELELAEAFFNPQVVKETGPDPVLKYLATDNAQEVDTKLVPGLRNFLFGPPGAGGLDLASLNIQRGRDHGLADYNTTRKYYGLAPVTDFNQITSDTQLQEKLRSLYGTVNNIDLWVGGLSEDHVAGASVGETFRAIMVNQFERIREGDRYWYQQTFKGKQLAAIEGTRLSDVIRRNTTVTKLQDNVFFFDDKNTLPSLIAKAGFIPADLLGNPLGKIVGATYDGSLHNEKYTYWGRTGVALLRLAPAGYADGVSAPGGTNRPSPRLISNTVAAIPEDDLGEEALRNERHLSDWIYGWGQFLDHDLDLTTGTADSFNVTVPSGDPSFDPENTGTQIIPLRRSIYDAASGTGTTLYIDKNYTLNRLSFSIGEALHLFKLVKVHLKPVLKTPEVVLPNATAETTIVGGPVEADGQTWWRIYLGGRTGWVTEATLFEITTP